MSRERSGEETEVAIQAKAGMLGPEILARTMSRATSRGKGADRWQYHSRSDSHSKVACWTLLFDLLLNCDVMRRAAKAKKIGFRINHVIVGPISKTLDLVVTWDPERDDAKRRTFSSLAAIYGVDLLPPERDALERLPELIEDLRDDVAEVAIALEAKACMTEHIKSLPRLHAEILATGYLAKRSVPDCIAVSYSLVNSSPTFVTPSGDGKVNQHTQPTDAYRVVEMLGSAIPLRTGSSEYGYDAIGVTVLDCRNDGTPVTVVRDPAIGPLKTQPTEYSRMVRSVCSRFRASFGVVRQDDDTADDSGG
jgi:hypothetical protein